MSADEALRPWRAQLDDRKPRVPFGLLRLAHEHAVSTRRAYADQPQTVRDYWPTCIEMVLIDAGLLDPEDAVLT